MLQLTYISTAKGIGENELSEILAISRRNNARDGITGLLLFNGRRFLQALEGPSDNVLLAYDRIKADSRHRAAVLLSSKPVQERQFGGWDMAFEHAGASDTRQSLIHTVDLLTAGVSDHSVRAHFQSYVRVQVAA